MDLIEQRDVLLLGTLIIVPAGLGALLELDCARVRCGSCGHEVLVGFSCKGRGFCPSCTTRRAHDIATHITKRELPAAPYRQWVLTYPRRHRCLLARRPTLLTLALRHFLRALFAWQRRAARARGVRGRAGAITFVQRFSSALRLNVHFA
jgi:hypothetical protein